MNTTTFHISKYNIETKTTNSDFLANKAIKNELNITVYKSSIAFDLIPKDVTKQPLRLKVYIESKNIITDIEEAIKQAFAQVEAKVTSEKYLTLYENNYMNQTFYTLEPLFKPKKLQWS